MIYAGIGSRRTPGEILTLMRGIGWHLGREGWILRTGGAPGADQAFQDGAANADGAIELYLPWESFEAASLAPITTAGTWIWREPSPAALGMASHHHPAWEHLKHGVRKLHARNCHQVLGGELNSLVDVLICWAPDGSLDGRGPDTGGTGMALRVARACGAPLVVNLARPEHFDFAMRVIGQHP